MVPIVIRNAGEIMAAHSMILTPGTVQVRVLEPISTTDWTAGSLDYEVSRLEEIYAETFDSWSI
jgi:putative phosphoserine phosphatase / 1-acylglycerol-3-phosphate O-acyltransferase